MIDYGGIKLNIRTNADATAKKLTACANAMDRLKKSAGALKTEMGDVINGSVTQSVDKATKSTKEALDNVGNGTKKVNRFRESVKKLFSTITSPAKNVKGFFASVGRIALYRAIRSMISGLTNAIKSGLTYIKEYSKAIGGSDALNANGTLNTYKNTFEMLKAEIGASVLPMIKSFIPILKQISEYATALFQQITLYTTWTTTGSGKYTYINPEYWDALSEDMDGATDSAKQLNKQLMKFDELNVISQDSKSGSETDYSQYFKTMYASKEEIDDAENRVLKLKAEIGAISGALLGLRVGGPLGLIAGALLGVSGGLEFGGEDKSGRTGLDIAMGKIRGWFDSLDEWYDETFGSDRKTVFDLNTTEFFAKIQEFWNGVLNFLIDVGFKIKIATLKAISFMTPDTILGIPNAQSVKYNDWLATAEREYEEWKNSLNSPTTYSTQGDLADRGYSSSYDRSAYSTSGVSGYNGIGSQTTTSSSGNSNHVVIEVKGGDEIVKTVNGKSASKLSRTGYTVNMLN